jgi:xanthine dehydrogenase small subunit
MIQFILNDQDISTSQPPGMTVLDFVRYHKNLKGTKIGCREGDCGACIILIGELIDDEVNYRTMTSCLMPLANAAGKHIVTVEGINPPNRQLTPVQQAMVDESGTQCGFCTVGFVMSLTGFCIDKTAKTPEMAVSAIDGNICRCTGYKSIEKAANSICHSLTRAQEDNLTGSSTSSPPYKGGVAEGRGGSLSLAINKQIVPEYFGNIAQRLSSFSLCQEENTSRADHLRKQAVLTRPFVSGGTDVYVQKPESMPETESEHLFYNDELRGIRDTGEYIEMGASTTVTDLLVSPVMQSLFPNLHKHLKLVSSTPIRNMATLAGNFINASPIGDMTIWFLALDAEITLSDGTPASLPATPQSGVPQLRTIPLRDLYQGYKQLAKAENEFITTIRFRKPTGDFRFNFEKISKRTYLDIATVNTAISLTIKTTPAEDWLPPALSDSTEPTGVDVVHMIQDAHVAAGGVAPVPLYLKQTSEYLRGKTITSETLAEANEIIQSEIAPISDVRGTETYKRLLLKQLFTAHFNELFDIIDI